MSKWYTSEINFAGLTPAEYPAVGQYLIGIDASTKAFMVMDHAGNIGPAGNFVQKHIVNFNDFSGSGQTSTLSLGTVPPGAVFAGIKFHQTEDFLTDEISNAMFRVGVTDSSDTVQYVNSYSGGVVLKEFVANSLAGPNSGVASNTLSGIGANIIFNSVSTQDLYVTIGVDSQNIGGNIVSLTASIFRVDFIVTAGATLSEKYFTFANQADEFYVWYNTGSSVDPAPGGFSGAPTGIEVVISVADNAATVARKTTAALVNHFGSALNFSCSANKIRISMLGPIAEAFAPDPGTSGFTINSLTNGNVTPLKTVADLISGQMEISVSWIIMP